MPRYTLRAFLNVALISSCLTPLTSGLSYATNENTANFDDLTSIPHQLPIGIYNHLHWHNLQISHPSPNSEDDKHGGLYPKSPYSDGVEPQNPMACHDTMTAPIFGAARMSATYFGSRVALFDLQQFSFGCVEMNPDTHQPTTKPKPCAVTVKGYSPGRSVDSFNGLQNLAGVKPFLEMTLWFTMTGDGNATEETKVRMPRMTSLDKTWWALGAVTFEALSDVPVQLCIDDVQYRTYNVTKWGRTFAPPEHDDNL